MKKTFSIELKIIIAATMVMLTLATAVVLKQVFYRTNDEVKFVYNSSSQHVQGDVNISEIFGGEVIDG